jgi:plasmid stabilization system protein ParE
MAAATAEERVVGAATTEAEDTAVVTDMDTVGMSRRAGAGRAERAERLARLHADRELLAREHPYLTYHLDEQNAVGIARGAVPMLLPDGRIDPIEIQIVFAPPYPARLPRVFEVGGRFTPNADRHLVGEARFCLNLDGVGEPDLRAPDALRDFMCDVICFLEQQLIYERIKRFPGPQWPHGEREAYARHIVEQLADQSPTAAARLWEAARGTQPPRNAPCPCGGGDKYKRCHLDLVTELARLATRHDLYRYDYESLERHAGVAA